MAGPKDVTIRVQALDGTWQTMGGETVRGVYPENVSLEADAWGSSSASFTLRRDPRAFFPDIGAFTPVEVDVGSTLVWSGRVRETPSQVAQRTISVQCEGWQFHLDDDVYQHTYVHSDLTAWTDARSLPTTDLAVFVTAGTVQAGDGALVIGFPNGGIVGNNRAAGAVLDLGPNSLAKRVIVDYDNVSFSSGSYTFYCKGSDDPNTIISGGENAFGVDPGLAVSPQGGTFSTPRRYMSVFIYRTAASGTETADRLVRIKSIKVFADTSYEAGAASVLTASTVVSDALDRATMLLSSDRSGIASTSLHIPEYAPATQTPRQAWTAVDSYHDWLKQIDVNRRPIYMAKPARPLFEVGAHSAIDDDDASANSGAEIYNRVIATGQSASGTPLAVSARPTAADTESVVDPGLQSISIAGYPTVGSTGASQATWSTGTFRAGFEYIAELVTKNTTGSGIGSVNTPIFGVYDPNALDYVFGGYSWTLGAGASIRMVVRWTPKQDWPATSVILRTNATIQYVVISRATPTLADRRSFRRTMQLPISSTLPEDGIAANTIGTVWLADHKTTPFRGSVTLTGDESLREITTGRDVGLEQLLLNTGQLIRFSDRSDPDTGGHGRDGRIAGVSYTPATNTAAVTIDNSRTSFDALLSRLAVVQSG
jgi:hypothetical protein